MCYLSIQFGTTLPNQELARLMPIIIDFATRGAKTTVKGIQKGAQNLEQGAGVATKGATKVATKVGRRASAITGQVMMSFPCAKHAATAAPTPTTPDLPSPTASETRTRRAAAPSVFAARVIGSADASDASALPGGPRREKPVPPEPFPYARNWTRVMLPSSLSMPSPPYLPWWHVAGTPSTGHVSCSRRRLASATARSSR